MGQAIKLPNIGKVTEALLHKAGIHTAEELCQMGSQQAFIALRQVDSTVCVNMLYGLEGAIQGVRDQDLPAETKKELLAFFRAID